MILDCGAIAQWLTVDQERVVLFLAWYFVFLLSVTAHEAAHALAALWLGDRTAYYGGQVTLNPLPHIERAPFGMVVVPLVSYWILGGWLIGWGSAPYDPAWAARYPRRAALMAVAGPLANLVLVLLAAGIIRAGLYFEYFRLPEYLFEAYFAFHELVQPGGEGLAVGAAQLVSILFLLNVILLVFNLLPFPPLDGHAVWYLVLRRETSSRMQDIFRHPAAPLIGILIAWKVFPMLRFYIFGYVIPWLLGEPISPR